MKALLTGGAGFVGSHLADALLARGHQVTVIDDLSTGSMDNIAHLKGRPGFDYVIDTIMNEPLTAELVDGADVVFHLAAAVGVKLIVEAPVRTIETNVHGTEIVLKHGAKKGKLTMIFSTSEVYGKSVAVPFSEDADLVHGADAQAPLGLRVQQGDRRIPRAGVLQGTRAAGRRGAAVQHRRPAADRPLRHGHSEFRAAGARRANRSRSTATARRRARSRTWATSSAVSSRWRSSRARSARCSTSAIPRRSRSWIWPDGSKRRRAARRRSSWCPTIRPTRPGSRTCRAGFPTSARSGISSATRPTLGLDAILQTVIEEQRGLLAAGHRR